MAKDILTVKVVGNAIVIRLPLSILPVVLEGAPFNEGPDGSCRPLYRVSNAALFAEAIAYELDAEKEDGTTPVHLLFDDVMEEAIENGCEGVDYVARRPESEPEP